MNRHPQKTGHYHYIDTQADLNRLQKKLRPARRIALDIEANSLYHYHEKVCLIQLSAQGTNYIVNPLGACDISGLLDLISLKDLIFHCGDYDLRMLRQSYGFSAHGRVFDTMIAAKLLGYHRFSLVDLIEQFTGTRVSKSSQKSNWTKRPLTEKQLLYASNDTHYLELLADRLEAELRQKDRLHWHDQTVERLLDTISNIAPPLECWRMWRIKGTRELDDHQMAVLRELWWWRESEASLADRPPFKIISNERLVSLVKALRRAIKKGDPNPELPRLPRHFNLDRVQRLRAALRRAIQQPQDQWPGRITGDFRPDYPNDLFEQLRQETARLAKAYHIEPSIIAPRSILGRIAEARPDSLEAMHACAPALLPWQARILFQPFMRIIDAYQQG